MSARPGMTLLELLIGLVVVGAALAAGYGALASVADHRERAVRTMERAAREALVRRTLVEWLRGARLTVDNGGPPFAGMDAVLDGVPDDELAFLTSAPTLAGVGDGVVRLFIDRDEETPERGLVAELSEWRGTRRERVELVPGAVSLDARYLFGVRGRRWIPGWITSSVLPLGVELRLAAAPGDTLPRLLAQPIVVATGRSR
ncbi:MAG: prepilin-type N-terminal cleavage/methylation domain-containing protein [Gemmatimonadota bacterium]